ncbi:MAG TPA: hypothetical protein VHM72_06375 [Solirubrobacteraceae bacterium]|nr:hypothetical protein [Solirubrobacteraceae bacterium]
MRGRDRLALSGVINVIRLQQITAGSIAKPDRIALGKRPRVIVGLAVLATIILRRRGYPMGGNVVVRCRKGHLFTTIWVPLASLKSIRLGWWRLQRCPVGKHWSLVRPVKEVDLSEAERRSASEHRDVRIP